MEKISIISAVSIGLFYFLYFTANNQVFGIDAWYWLKFGFQKPLYHNLIMLLMWISIFMFFKLSGRKNPYFYASLFLLVPFNLRLLEVELDDYLYYLFSFLLISFTKFKRLVTISIMVFYLAVHYFFLFSDFVHTEITWNPLVLSLAIPFFIILLENKKYKSFLLVFFISLLFSFGKFVGSVLPIYAFAFFLLNDVKISRQTFMFLIVFSLVIYFVSAINMVEANKKAFEKYCNAETKICNNYEEPHYGHYFAYLGYISNNSYEFGVCTCVGQECLNRTIKC